MTAMLGPPNIGHSPNSISERNTKLSTSQSSLGERLLGGLMEANQAASELTEDQVLNFLVNTLDEEIDIGLGENANIDSEDIWDVLVGATADEDSVTHLCEISEESPHGNTILHHLRARTNRQDSHPARHPRNSSKSAGGGRRRPPPPSVLRRGVRLKERALPVPRQSWNDHVPRVRQSRWRA